MIAFRYTKTDGAEFISHLDVLRHLNKIFLRSGIEVKESNGFHPHMLIFMASPTGLGIKSLAEYCTVDADIPPEQFKERFNAASPKGIKCVFAKTVGKNPNFAAAIDRAGYYIEGIGDFDPLEILSLSSFTVTKDGKEKEVRDRIFSLEKRGGGIYAVLAAGNCTLRPELFAAALTERYGGEADIIKQKSYVGEADAEEFIRSLG